MRDAIARPGYREIARLGAAWKMTWTARCYTQRLLEGLSHAQLLAIPAGFDTNLLWGLGHLAYSMDRMLYPQAGLPSPLPTWFEAHFRPGVTSLDWPQTPDVDAVLAQFDAQLARVHRDLRDGALRRYTPLRIDTGAKIGTLADALAFNAAHEGFHAGTLSAERPLVLRMT
jgi:DinB superfamily